MIVNNLKYSFLPEYKYSYEITSASGDQGALFEKTAREASGPLQKLLIKKEKKNWPVPKNPIDFFRDLDYYNSAMETYKNAYKKEEDELLWEIHEIRRKIHRDFKGKTIDQINKEALEKFSLWKKQAEEERSNH